MSATDRLDAAAKRRLIAQALARRAATPAAPAARPSTTSCALPRPGAPRLICIGLPPARVAELAAATPSLELHAPTAIDLGALADLCTQPTALLAADDASSRAVDVAAALERRGLALHALVVVDAPAPTRQPVATPIVAINCPLAWADATTGPCALHRVDDPWDALPGLLSHTLPSAHASARTGDLGFGLFFFSCDETDHGDDAYRLLRASAAFADRHGFEAVWLPERHFHTVGGLFPNPSLLAAALATSTERVALRAGSVVLPLHDPLRVAEEWAVVDNLSRGRAELAIVPGWNPDDYAFAPDAYDTRWDRTFEALRDLRTLWAGGPIERTNGRGEVVELRTHPRPVQPHLPLWITTSARDASFVRAGELGADLLTALLIQSTDDLARRIDLYREARERAGHDPATGRVAVMVHTYVGADDQATRRAVRDPFLGYMHSVQSLWKGGVQALDLNDPDAVARVVDMVFERYYQRATLFGDVDECVRRARVLRDAGATELACAIDFGVPFDQTLAGLCRLARVRQAFATTPTEEQR